MTTKLELLTNRAYLSYSSLSSWLDCGERFRLERVLNAPQTNAWWFLGGSAFHEATELLDKGEVDSPVTAWNMAWAKQLETLKPNEVLKAGGRVSKEWPDKENDLWWNAKGPSMVQDYVTWRDQKFAEGWQWYALPDGSPAIECAVHIDYENVLIKGYIDRVMVNDSGEVIVIDLKTGSRVPESTLQLGVYSAALRATLGLHAGLGAYYMSRKGELTDPKSLLHYSDAVLDDWFTKTKTAIESEIFIPKVGPFCNSCSVSPYCVAVGGNDSALRSPALRDAMQHVPTNQ